MKKSKHKEKIQLELNTNLSDKELVFSDLDWSGIREESIGFNTHHLKTIDKDTLAFEQNIWLLQTSKIFLSVGIGMIGASIIMWRAAILLIMFGSVFMFCGLCIRGLGSRSFVFDRYNKVYRDEFYRRGDPWVSFFYENVQDTYIDFDNIIAIQFLNQYESDNDDSFYFYQINLVLHDKSRINIVNYENEETAKKDATHLAEFLGVPFLEKESE